MKKFEKLVKEIKDGVEYEMRESIAAGWNHLSYEHDFGNTTVMVEVELVGWRIRFFDSLPASL